MKVFVTLGTTPFNELLDALNEQGLDKIFDLVIQSPTSESYYFKNIFKFTNEIDKWYNWADVIITHAGAGSIYQLLELGKKLVVVPNTYRKDKHQLDIANFVQVNKYAHVCYQLSFLSECIKDAEHIEFIPYSKDDFHGEQLIAQTLF